MRSLRDGESGWSKGSGSCCAWAEERPAAREPWSLCPHGHPGAPVLMGVPEPLSSWEPWSLCPHGHPGAPVPTGAPEPLSPWEPWSLCPCCCCSPCSGGSPQRAVPWTGAPRGAEVRAKREGGSLRPPGRYRGALCSDAEHRPSARGLLGPRLFNVSETPQSRGT